MSLPRDFDWKYYVLKYPDLWNNNIRDPVSAKAHYLNHGMKEGRKVSGDYKELKESIKQIRDYIYTSDFLNKTNFLRFAKDYKDKPASFLEVGVYEGKCTCFCLQNFLTHPQSTITVIDTFEGSMEHEKGFCSALLFDIFKHNIELTNSANKVLIKRGYSKDALRTLIGNKYDFIYIDASHTTWDVLQDAVLSFLLLKVGGVLLFDDYLWNVFNDPLLCPKKGIDAFLDCFSKFYQILDKGGQVAIRKTGET
jgi:predicted O-methyltransferase YrrM